MKKISTACILLLLTLSVVAQNKKEILQKEITAQIIYEQNFEKGETEPLTTKEERYNKEGLIVEEKDFDEKGKAKNWKKYSYNQNGKIIVEEYFYSNGKLFKKIEYKYENGLKVEKLYFDSKGRLYKKKIYKYEFGK